MIPVVALRAVAKHSLYYKNMAQSKFSENIIKMKCSVCNRIGYYTRKNKKTNEKKLALEKHCAWCRKHTTHKEVK